MLTILLGHLRLEADLRVDEIQVEVAFSRQEEELVREVRLDAHIQILILHELTHLLAIERLNDNFLFEILWRAISERKRRLHEGKLAASETLVESDVLLVQVVLIVVRQPVSLDLVEGIVVERHVHVVERIDRAQAR